MTKTLPTGRDPQTGQFTTGECSPDKYPARFTFLPYDFCDKPSDNKALLSVGDAIYLEPFQVLEPSPKSLGINTTSRKVHTKIEFGDFYVIWAIGTTLHKIGVSSDIRKRFRDLSSASPLPLMVVRYGRCDNPNLIESHFHKMFAAKLFKNEWYSLSEGDLEKIDNVLDKYFEKPSVGK